MRPSDRTIRDVLRTQAARVPVPDDMWQNISRQLDADLDQVQKERHAAQSRPAPRHYQWRPAIMFAAAAGVFWLTFVPPAHQAPADYEVPAHEQLQRPVPGPRVQQAVVSNTESAGLTPMNRREYERQRGVVEISPMNRLKYNLGRSSEQL